MKIPGLRPQQRLDRPPLVHGPIRFCYLIKGKA